MLFLDLLVPEPEPEPEPEVVKPAKKKRKPRSKSPRAVSLAEQIKGKGGEVNSVAITLCGASLESSGADCNLPEGHALHIDKGYVDYHPFTPPVPGAGEQSSASNGADGSILNSEGETASAGAVVGGLSD
jgi:hypothetical protein